jgi:hypothetical protein
MLSKNGFFIDSIPSEIVESSRKLRRLIEDREEETIKLNELVNKLKLIIISNSSELKLQRSSQVDADQEYMKLRIENEKLRQQVNFLEQKNLNMLKENEDLASIIKKNDTEHNLIREQQELLLSNLRLSIEELTQKSRPMEEQRILVQSLRETISSLAEENDRLRQSAHSQSSS